MHVVIEKPCTKNLLVQEVTANEQRLRCVYLRRKLHVEKCALYKQANDMCRLPGRMSVSCVLFLNLSLFPCSRQQSFRSIVYLFILQEFSKTNFNHTIQILQSTNICPFTVYLPFERFKYLCMNTKRRKLITRVISMCR